MAVAGLLPGIHDTPPPPHGEKHEMNTWECHTPVGLNNTFMQFM